MGQNSPNILEKVPNTFWIWSTAPAFSTQKSKNVDAPKVYQNFWIASGGFLGSSLTQATYLMINPTFLVIFEAVSKGESLITVGRLHQTKGVMYVTITNAYLFAYNLSVCLV